MDRRQVKRGKGPQSEIYERTDGRILITGSQALVRLMLDQARRDREAGLRTGGFASGYRGSPLAGLDMQFERARPLLAEADIHFEPGINEDLAATAVWGAQETPRQKGARVEGVFGLWYGKAPGVDRSGDALRHANVAGTSAHGGALAVAGDDPLGKSSTLPCQSEQALADFEIPFFAPASVGEVLEYGLHGFALSRYSGLWAGMIATADTMDATATVELHRGRPAIAWPRPDFPNNPPFPGRLMLTERVGVERTLREVRLPGALDYIRANGLNRIVWDSANPRLGIVASGKSWMVLTEALAMMGIDAQVAAMAGIRLMKLAVPWPLEPEMAGIFAEGLETALVVENKRPLIEAQFKQHLYHLPEGRRPAVVGKTSERGERLLPDTGEITVDQLVPVIFNLLPEAARTEAMREAMLRINRSHESALALGGGAARVPYFCSGCPHSSSTKVPEGATALSGIGCHIMSQWMGREQGGTTHMGAEGASWIGMAPFIEDAHAFVNIGDGTYQHSGLMAIRAAVAAGAPMTYKILFNDAVAMTGGQAVDGALTVDAIARQLAGEGVGRIVIVADQPGRHAGADLPRGTTVRPREELDAVQRELQHWPGVSALIYDQICAAEKRRRRARKQYPDPPKRLFINPRVCEGCGDCSVQSNCISVEPLETPFGTKRRINQDSCNKDYTCGTGFCPAFTVVEGGTRRRPEMDLDALVRRAGTLEPSAPAPVGNGYTLVFTGIGGTGVTAASAILAMAADIEGLAVTTLDMVGLAQKGGGVATHLRFAPGGADLPGVTIGPGRADALIAGDLLVSTAESTLRLLDEGRTRAIANSAIAPTADFVLKQALPYQPAEVLARLTAAVESLEARDVAAAAREKMGDSIFANMLLLGMASQAGLLPFGPASIEQAVRLKGLAVEKNLAAFAAGRLLLAGDAPAVEAAPEETAAALADRLEAELVAYQDAAYAAGYRRLVDAAARAEQARAAGSDRFARSVANGLFRLMAYKDEYEVARLYSDPAFRAALNEQFEGTEKLSVLLAPPLIARTDPATGRPAKAAYGPWIFRFFGLLQRLRFLRGSRLDPFGWTAERRAERALVAEYEQTVSTLIEGLGPENHGQACEIAALPDEIRGFGPVKEKAMARVAAKKTLLMAGFTAAKPCGPANDGLSQAAE